MNAPEFRACIGPSAGRCHIRLINSGPAVMCGVCAYARDVDGVISHTRLCLKCIGAMARYCAVAKNEGFTIPKCDSAEGLAQALGLEKII